MRSSSPWSAVTGICGVTTRSLLQQGKNPFSLDSKAPQWDKFQDYLAGEVRFAALKKAQPDQAQELYDETEKSAKRRYQSYVRKAAEDWSEVI
jgi:pyruvate-ferredoxin/flavodoxin oxidoreductase